MPAKSTKQKKFMGFLKGNPKERMKVGLSEKQVDHFVKSPVKKSSREKRYGER